jgi:ATP-binding cassette subfamily C protein
MMPHNDGIGRQELSAAKGHGRPLYLTLFLFSFFVNLLMLTGPLYMLQVYDRVLGSRSQETLLALSILMVFLFIAAGFLDYARSQINARLAARLQSALDQRVFQAALRRLAIVPNDQTALTAQQDLEAVQRYIASPAHLALFDLPWSPLFFAAIFVFHPLLGWLALAGALCLIALMLLNRHMAQAPLTFATATAGHAERMAETLKTEAEAVQALGMTGAGFDRWHMLRQTALAASVVAGDLGSFFTVTSRTFRLFLQSAMLGLGAYLVLQAELSAGAMIAGSILMGRALTPIETIVGQWASMQRSQDGWARLATLLTRQPPPKVKTALPRPRAALEVSTLTVVPPGSKHATVRMVSFTVHPGQAMGIIGPSGSGKTCLARALTGVWPPTI